MKGGAASARQDRKGRDGAELAAGESRLGGVEQGEIGAGARRVRRIAWVGLQAGQGRVGTGCGGAALGTIPVTAMFRPDTEG